MKRALHLVIVLFASLATAVAVAFPGPDSGPGPGSGSYLGVNVRALSAARAQSLGLKNPTGVEVTLVDQDAPAGRAGVNEGDVIFSVSGNRIENEDQLRRLVRQIPPGSTVVLGVYRAGQQFNLQVTLADRSQVTRPAVSSPSVFPQQPDFNFPAMPGFPFSIEIEMPSFTTVYPSRSGMLFEELTPQLCQHFGMKHGRGGLLVRGVEKGSPADAAGIKPGDIVIQVEKEFVSDVDDWYHATVRRTGPANITVLRDRHEATLSLKFGGRRSAAKP